jgi:hypothetical protein
VGGGGVGVGVGVGLGHQLGLFGLSSQQGLGAAARSGSDAASAPMPKNWRRVNLLLVILEAAFELTPRATYPTG